MSRVACSLLALSLASACPAQAADPAKPTAAALPEIGPDGKPKLGVAEAQQSFEALGYRIGNGTALNLCGKPTTTIKVTYKDLNGDGFPEAIGVDNDKACYGGPFVTIAQRQPNGVWAWLFRERGEVGWATTRTKGWLDMTIKTRCVTSFIHDGSRYAQNGYCAADHPNPDAQAPTLPVPADFNAAFQAAGMVRKNGSWTGCADDGYGRAEVQNGDYRDINQDGVNDLIITDSGTFCYGNTGQGFVILTRSAANAQWKVFYSSPGIPTFVKTTVKTPGGWPDVEIGGPGFCFPINRWNGKDYVFNRNKEYEKGACARR